MQIYSAGYLIGLLAMIGGALHVLGPDHWIPTSVLAWQKKWTQSQTVVFSMSAFFVHVFWGYLLFLLLQNWMIKRPDSEFLVLALGLMVGMAVVRRTRFPRVQKIFRIGHQGLKGNVAALLLLGPCEIILPIFVKAKLLGVGYIVPFVCFLLGTVAAGVFVVLWGRAQWNRPFALPVELRAILRPRAVLPLVAGVSVGGFFLLL